MENTGYAFTASICDSDARRATSMICWYNSTLVTAGIVAHEIGHTVGFFHDFAPVTTAKYSNARTRTCGPGKDVGGPDNMIMNYNWDKVYQWSSCSNEDFKNYFLWMTETKKQSFCLKGTFSDNKSLE